MHNRLPVRVGDGCETGQAVYTPRPHATAYSVCVGAAWQVEEMRRENEAIEAAQRAEAEKEGATAEEEAQAELLV